MVLRPQYTLAAALILFALAPSVAKADGNCPATLNVNKEPLTSNKSVNLCGQYLGKVVMIVNTASYCGFTKQYKSLEELYSKYQARGLVVLGFPSNDFGEQEPGSEEQIKAFCERTYGVKFPMFGKTHVTKGTSDTLYKTLGDMAGEYPTWNFHKYLLDRKGNLVASFASQIDPENASVVSKIESLL